MVLPVDLVYQLDLVLLVLALAPELELDLESVLPELNP